jgi:hypothetical protein
MHSRIPFDPNVVEMYNEFDAMTAWLTCASYKPALTMERWEGFDT